MRTGRVWQSILLAGLIGAPLALAGPAFAAVAIAPPAPAAAHSAAPVVTRVVPISAAVAPDAPALARASSDFAQFDPARLDPGLTPFHRMTRTRVLGNLSIAEVAIIGGVLIGLTIYARRRHRRRDGWAFMPDRSLGRARSDR